jgi:uncharacterized delta-60 repeat protein
MPLSTRLVLFAPRALRLAAATTALSVLTLASARAQSPGSQDTTFATGASANGPFYALVLPGNGQAIVGGSFTTFNGVNRNLVARVNSDGSLDTFNPGLALSGYQGGTGTVQALAVQSNGQILAAGSFTVVNGAAGAGVVRLNSDASVDTAFSVGTGVVNDGDQVGTAYTVNVLPNGQILVGGAFQSFNGVNVAGLVRLNTDGSVDTSFNPGGAGITANSYGGSVNSVVVLGNGSIVIGGYFSAYDGQSANGVARLNADGTLDTTFNVGDGVDDGGITAVAVQANGAVLVGGGFSSFDGLSVPPLLRLNTDGSLDTSYDPSGDLFIASVDALLVQPDGTVLAGGAFLSQGGLVNSPHNGLARFLSDGSEDPSFDSGTNSLQVTALALQGNGEAVTAANPYQLTGVETGNVYRYFDLTLYPSFFDGQVSVGNGVYYLSFPSGNYFGYYSFLSNPAYIYHFDLGYEYVFDAADGNSGVYFYDFKSGSFFYTSPGFPFPYLYDFSLNSTVYYYPDPTEPGHYNTNGVRYFYVFSTGQIVAL